MSDTLYVSFESPTHPLQGGNGLQVWRLAVRKSGSGGDPTFSVELWEGGVFRALVIPPTQVVNNTYQLLVGIWDAALLAKRSGVDVEGRIVSERGDGPDGDAKVEIASFEWNPAVYGSDLNPSALRAFFVVGANRSFSASAHSISMTSSPPTRSFAAPPRRLF